MLPTVNDQSGDAVAPKRERPIGVFDSGVGGLSVLAELQRELPHEQFLYLGDTRNVPYGSRSQEGIRSLVDQAVVGLHRRGIKALVLASSTITTVSLTDLRSRFTLPIIGTLPAIATAVHATRSGVIGVLATRATVDGDWLRAVIEQEAGPAGVRVVTASHPALVPLIESGQADGPRARQVLREVLGPLRDAGSDQLVLGSTHFSFLRRSIQSGFGNAFVLVDSGAAVAQDTRAVLRAQGLLSARSGPGDVTVLVTGDADQARPTITALMARSGHPRSSPGKAPPPRIEQV